AFDRALVKIGSEPSLAELRESAENLLAEVRRNLAEIDHFREFSKQRDDVLFHATLATGEGRQANLDATQRAGWTALGLFGVTLNDQVPLALKSLKSPFTENEKA